MLKGLILNTQLFGTKKIFMDRCSSVFNLFIPFTYEYNIFNMLQYTLYRILMAVFWALITQYCTTEISVTCMFLWYMHCIFLQVF